MPAFRIFNSVLGDHSWAADGRLCIAQQPQSDVSGTITEG
jgi:hypothetical protein